MFCADSLKPKKKKKQKPKQKTKQQTQTNKKQTKNPHKNQKTKLEKMKDSGSSCISQQELQDEAVLGCRAVPVSPSVWGLFGLPWCASSWSLSLNMPVPLPGQCVTEQGHALAQSVHCTLEFSNKLITAYF